MMQKGKALHVLVSVSVLDDKPIGIMADTALFSLAFFDYDCTFDYARSTCLTLNFWWQPEMTEITVGV